MKKKEYRQILVPVTQLPPTMELFYKTVGQYYKQGMDIDTSQSHDSDFLFLLVLLCAVQKSYQLGGKRKKNSTDAFLLGTLWVLPPLLRVGEVAL